MAIETVQVKSPSGAYTFTGYVTTTHDGKPYPAIRDMDPPQWDLLGRREMEQVWAALLVAWGERPFIDPCDAIKDAMTR